MPLTVGDRDVRPLTADEVVRMVEAGILGEDERVELLQGVLTAMSPQDPPHAIVVQRLTAWLAPVMVADSCDVRVQLPLAVPDATSLPEPDIAVVERAGPRVDHPSTARLVVEVAGSSLRVDTAIKSALYAAAGVPEYWVVDVRGRRVHRFSVAAAERYTRSAVVHRAALITPAAVEVGPLDLDRLFEGL